MAKLDRLFIELKERGASDLHLSVGFPPMLRVHGEVMPLKIPPLTDDQLKQLVFEIMRPEQVEIATREWDLDFAYSIENVARFRANVFFTHRGMAAVFRIIPAEIKHIDAMGFPPAVKKLAELEKGMVLVTGPTGSGKSTTLASMINHINETREAHIITIEDPIEFVHPPKKCLVTQREVHYHARSFATALRAACREDPDVILVGEMRDVETIGLALTAAELGVLIFGTLHTNSAGKTVDRIIDVFPVEAQAQVRTMLADSLKGVIAQQLIRTSDGRGRAAALEIMVGGSALANLVREGKTTQIASMIQTGASEGMVLMDQSLMALVKAGKIDRQEAALRAMDKKPFETTA